MSQDIVNALEDPNGTEVLVALLESGANVTLPTKVSSQHMIFHKSMIPSYPAIPFCSVWWGRKQRAEAPKMSCIEPLHYECAYVHVHYNIIYAHKIAIGTISVVLPSRVVSMQCT